MADQAQPIIIKKVKKGGHGHHGGAWKVAYADFVTAMMAFFLLLWLLSATTEEQKKGIADYFSPTAPSTQTSGGGGVMGGTSVANDGAQSSGSVMLENPFGMQPTPPQTASSSDATAQNPVENLLAEREEERFRMAQQNLKTELRDIPELGSVDEHLIVDLTSDGMRIQLVDNGDQSMFEDGTAELRPFARHMLEKVAKVVMTLPNRIKVAGHTDSTPFRAGSDYGNWELSADRANASRRLLAQNDISAERFYEVTGKADTEPLFPEDPDMPANRRVSIVLMREAPVLPPGYVR